MTMAERRAPGLIAALAAALAATLLVVACNPPPARAVRLGSKSDPESRAVAETVARRLEHAGCPVERRFDLPDSGTADRALVAGEIDAYVESHAIALTQILKKPELPGPAAETAVRGAYIRRNLLWAPPLGTRDLAVVYRKPVDERCRAASRTFMATGSMQRKN